MNLLADWHSSFQKAIIILFHGGNPYTQMDGFYNPIYALVLLSPLNLFKNDNVLLLAFLMLSLTSYMILGIWLHKRLSGILLLMLNPFTVLLVMLGNIDWLVWFGINFPLWLALVFFSIKPQITIGLVIYMTIRNLLKRGILHTVMSYIPVTFLLAGMLLLFGIPNTPNLSIHTCTNTIIMYTIPVAVVLIIIAIVKKRPSFAIAAGPLLAPYVCRHSFVPVLAMFDGFGAIVALISVYVFTIVANRNGISIGR